MNRVCPYNSKVRCSCIEMCKRNGFKTDLGRDATAEDIFNLFQVFQKVMSTRGFVVTPYYIEKLNQQTFEKLHDKTFELYVVKKYSDTVGGSGGMKEEKVTIIKQSKA